MKLRHRGIVAAVLLATWATTARAGDANPCPDDPRGADAEWTLSTTTFDPTFSRHPFVGNGYLGQVVPPAGMGYVATGEKTGWPLYTPRYDGAFIAGVYAQQPQLAGNRQVIAAIPTWTTLTLGVGNETYSPSTPADEIANFRQTLFLRCGLVRTALTWTADGKSTDLVYDVLADRVDAHVAAVRLSMTPRWSGRATVTAVLDGAGARRISPTGGAAAPDGTTADVTFSTDTTKVAGAVASTLRAGRNVLPKARANAIDGLTARQALTFPVRDGESYELVKYVGVDTSLTSRLPRNAARTASRAAAARGWRQLLARHALSWRTLWRSDIVVAGRPELQAWVRGGLYSLLASARQGQAYSVGPAGLSSDNYAGLIFWDAETWMYPGLLLLHPDIARSMLEYRYKTMSGARTNVARLGYQGIFYPWTSASAGDLPSECHSVDPPHCRTQVHLQGDIALAAWHYYLATKDAAWLRSRGWPMLKGIAEFWASRVTKNADGSYSIDDTAGPDEYSNGVNDAVFTNAGAATALRNATRAAQVLGEPAPEQWNAIAGKLRIPFDEIKRVFVQYDGYKGTRIKQADTVLLMYPLEWPMPKEVAAATLDFYASLTDPDGPAMTDSVHAIDAAAIGEPGCATYTYLMRSIRPFVREPFAQFAEARGAKAGVLDPHSGAPALTFTTGSGGFAQVFTHGLTGLRWRQDRVYLDPMLPPQMKDGVTLTGLHWQGRTFDIAIRADQTTVTQTAGVPFSIESPEGARTVRLERPLTLRTRRPDLIATDNAARCVPSRATSEEPGFYADAAVDGNRATVWAPDAAQGSLTADLGRPTRIARIGVVWNEPPPASFQLLVSPDGDSWAAVSAAAAAGELPLPIVGRYVRVEVQASSADRRTGIRELEVIRAPDAGP
jgi:trehalose/maltose hydrolase-like predicted phosphorylase